MNRSGARRSRVLALAAMVALASCGGGAPPKLEVYAAASLRDALEEVVAIWRADGGAPVALNFGPSGGLARQIVAARRADVFLSAGELEMDRVEEAGLVVEGTRASLLSNRLVVVEPAARESLFTQPFEPTQLAAVGLERLSIGSPAHVPAGRYARAWLEREGLWEALAPQVTPAVDARAALATVESGAARAGLVYASDAALSDRVRVVHVVPAERAPAISYPAAVLRGRGDPADGRAFLDHLRSTPAREVLDRFGFVLTPR